MSKSSFCLLQTPIYVTDADGLLGSLVTNITRPTDGCYSTRQGSAHIPEAHLLRPVRKLQSSIAVRTVNGGEVDVQFQNFIGSGSGSERERNLQLLSKELSVHRARNHDELLRDILQQEGAEKWVESAGEVYLLVSYITAKDAHVVTGDRTLSNANGHITLPIAQAVGLPVNLDVGLDVSRQNERATVQQARVPGEVVFAAEYRRVKKKRVIFRKMCKLGGYPEGTMAFGYSDSNDSEDSECEVEEEGYVLDVVQGELVLKDEIST